MKEKAKSNVYSLSSWREKRERARAYHPSIWTPQDAVDTANDFHAELAQAERGAAVDGAGEGGLW